MRWQKYYKTLNNTSLVVQNKNNHSPYRCLIIRPRSWPTAVADTQLFSNTRGWDVNRRPVVVSEHSQWITHSRTSCQGSCSPTTRKSDLEDHPQCPPLIDDPLTVFFPPIFVSPHSREGGLLLCTSDRKKIPRGIKIVRGVMSGQEGLWGVEHVQSFVYLFIYPQQSAIQAVEGERDGGSCWTQTSTDSLLLSHLMPGQSFQFQSACP